VTQLDRIEAKLNWLRWRARWGEIARIDVLNGFPVMIPRKEDPEPLWPEEEEAHENTRNLHRDSGT